MAQEQKIIQYYALKIKLKKFNNIISVYFVYNLLNSGHKSLSNWMPLDASKSPYLLTAAVVMALNERLKFKYTLKSVLLKETCDHNIFKYLSQVYEHCAMRLPQFFNLSANYYQEARVLTRGR